MRKFEMAIAIACLLGVASCSKQTSASTAVDVDGGPTEQVLRDFMFKQYEVMNSQGGVPMTVTQTGKGGKVRSKLYEVHKDKCAPFTASKVPGMYQCTVNLMTTMWWEGMQEPSKPLKDAKRVRAMRDPKGVWIDCTYASGPNSVCRR